MGEEVYNKKVKYVRSFTSVSLGETLVYTNSLMNMAVAIHQGNFSQKYNIGAGNDWNIIFKKIK